MANDAHEEFWGCTLTKDKKEFEWNPTETEDDVEHKLQVTSACLGHKAKENERNLVELTTEDDDGRKITCSMVSLRAGGKECLHLELGFNNPTKFVLKEGSGPISLCGVHLQAVPIDFDEDGESDTDDEDIPNLVEPKEIKKDEKIVEKKSEKAVEKKDKKDEKKEETKSSPVKRPLQDTKKQDKPAAKKKKPEPEPEPESDEEEDEGDEEDDDEEDDDEEMPSLLDGEAEEDEDDEDSEDEDEPEEGDEVDSDEEEEGDEDDDEDEEDEKEDSEEEEEEETPVKPNKKIANGHTPKPKGKPEPKKTEKTPKKDIQKSQPVTPKSAGPKKTPDEIKAMLLKSPNLPKKFDKFTNYMKNNLKITDEKSQKDFWDYVQKNKK